MHGANKTIKINLILLTIFLSGILLYSDNTIHKTHKLSTKSLRPKEVSENNTENSSKVLIDKTCLEKLQQDSLYKSIGLALLFLLLGSGVLLITAMRFRSMEQQKLLNKLSTLVEILEKEASHDSLTGLPNRRLFFQRLTQTMKLAARYGHKLAIMALDLDGFKKINDNLGHLAGDEILQKTSKLLKETFRDADTVARLGGDEFAVILYNIIDKKHVSVAAKRLLSSAALEFKEEGEYWQGISIGISIYPDDALKKNELLAFADTSMYAVKKTGKNNFIFYDEIQTKHLLT